MLTEFRNDGIMEWRNHGQAENSIPLKLRFAGWGYNKAKSDRACSIVCILIEVYVPIGLTRMR